MSSKSNQREIIWVEPQLKRELKIIKAERNMKTIGDVIGDFLEERKPKGRVPLWPKV